MTSTVRRPTFYEGQILSSVDLSRSVDFSREQDARHERYLHSWGLAEGLEGKEQNGEWFLTPGFAVDSAGAHIVVTDALRLDAEQLNDDALPKERDSDKFFPVFLVRTESRGEEDPLSSRCGAPGASRLSEGAAVRFRSFATGWDEQTPAEIADGPGERPDPTRVVLVGFVQWKHVPNTKGKITNFTRRDPSSGIGPRYVGTAADEVVAQGGELALWSKRKKQVASPAVIIGDHRTNEDQQALRLGLDDGKGNINNLLTVDPKGNLWLKGNLTAEGTLSGKLKKGDVSIESGIAGDGMTLPLPPGITSEQIANGDVVLHVSVTPRLDRLVDPVNITPEHVPIVTECQADDNLLVKCVIKWVNLGELAQQVDVAGSVDYTIIAYVNKSDGDAT